MKKPEPIVEYEEAQPEGIAFHFGEHSRWLTGFEAWLYRGMVWMYGEPIAAARFWAINGGSDSLAGVAAVNPESGIL